MKGCLTCGEPAEVCGDYCKGLRVGDRVVFKEPGFSRTGCRGKVEGARPFALLVAFDDGVVGTWKRDFFEKEQGS